MANENTPAGRIAAALVGKPDNAYAAVSAADVAAVGQAVKTHTRETAAVVGGALKVVSERWGLAAEDPRLIVHQPVEALKALLAAAGG